MNAPDLTKPVVINTKTGRYIIVSQDDFLSKQLIKKGVWEEYILNILDMLMDKRAGDFLDIGANIGAISIPLALHYKTRKFYCFEAQRQLFQQICGNAVLNMTSNIYAYHKAIGNPQQAGESIQVPVLAPTHTHVGALSLDERVIAVKQEQHEEYESVELIKIDDMPLANIGIIKIDVEGMEFDVLLGMKETLIRNNYPAILFELWRDGEFAWIKEEKDKIVSYLESLGYRVDIFSDITSGIAQHSSAEQIEFNVNVKKGAS